MSTYRVEITATDAIGRSGIVGGEHTTVITTADISADEAYTTIVGIGGQGGIADAHFCGAATAIRSSDLSLAERLRDHYGLSRRLERLWEAHRRLCWPSVGCGCSPGGPLSPTPGLTSSPM